MQTMPQRNALRLLTRKRFRRLTPAAYFWLPYFAVLVLLAAYAVVA